MKNPFKKLGQLIGKMKCRLYSSCCCGKQVIIDTTTV